MDYYEHVDDCCGIISQIQTSFAFGTIPINLTCIDVSTDLIAIGTDVGAIFLYNRRIGRIAKP